MNIDKITITHIPNQEELESWKLRKVDLKIDENISSINNQLDRKAALRNGDETEFFYIDHPVEDFDAVTMEYLKTLTSGESNTELQGHISNTSNPHNVTKEQVGLGNVRNEPTASVNDFNDHVVKDYQDSVHNFGSASVVNEGEADNEVRTNENIDLEEGIVTALEKVLVVTDDSGTYNFIPKLPSGTNLQAQTLDNGETISSTIATMNQFIVFGTQEGNRYIVEHGSLTQSSSAENNPILFTALIPEKFMFYCYEDANNSEVKIKRNNLYDIDTIDRDTTIATTATPTHFFIIDSSYTENSTVLYLVLDNNEIYQLSTGLTTEWAVSISDDIVEVTPSEEGIFVFLDTEEVRLIDFSGSTVDTWSMETYTGTIRAVAKDRNQIIYFVDGDSEYKILDTSGPTTETFTTQGTVENIFRHDYGYSIIQNDSVLGNSKYFLEKVNTENNVMYRYMINEDNIDTISLFPANNYYASKEQ